MDRLYLITRRDLPPGPQAVQSCHAMAAFAIEHREAFEAWFQGSNTLALVSVENERELESLLDTANSKGISASDVREPDLEDQLTALAFGPEGRKICRGLTPTLRKSHDLLCNISDGAQEGGGRPRNEGKENSLGREERQAW